MTQSTLKWALVVALASSVGTITGWLLRADNSAPYHYSAYAIIASVLVYAWLWIRRKLIRIQAEKEAWEAVLVKLYARRKELEVANKLAVAGTIFVCGACGKTSRWAYGFDDKNKYVDADGKRYASDGWDESCMMNAVLCHEASIVRNAAGRITNADPADRPMELIRKAEG